MSMNSFSTDMINDSTAPIIVNSIEQKERTSESYVLDGQMTVDCEVAINLVEESDIQRNNAESASEEDCAIEKIETSSVKKEDIAQYQCFYCRINCEDMTEMEKHYKTHTAPPPFKNCKIGFECKSSLAAQTYNSDQTNGPISCLVCSFISEDEHILKEHIIKSHSDCPPFLCAECNKVFNINRKFSSHLLLHTSEKPYKCSHCSFSCKRRNYLRIHIISMHSAGRRFSCRMCFYTCKRKGDLKIHLEKHVEGKRFKCEACPFASKSVNYLKKHRLIHKGIFPFHCNTCDFQCVAKSLLQTHYINHHTTEKPFLCETCGIRFKRNCTLLRHMITHSTDRSFKCNLCDYVCNRKDNLKSHIFIAHTDTNPFKCDKCSFRCKVKAVLNFHQKMHDPGKPFECSRCSYRFLTETKLRKHAVSHSFERTFPCQKCLFKGKTRSELNTHTHYCHGTSYPFACPICPFVCKKQSTLFNHVKKHNTGNKRNGCNLKFEQSNAFQRHVMPLAMHKQQNNINTPPMSRVSIHIDSQAESPVIESEKDYDSLEEESDCVGIKILNVTNDDEVKTTFFKKEKQNANSSVLSETGDKPLNYHCECCFMKCSSITELRHHMKQHSSLNAYQCPVCKDTFDSRTDLKDHMTFRHTDYKPFKCKICNLNFRLKTNLAQHSVIHSDDRPYKCSLCDYTSKLKETLRRHYVVHSTEKPYKCSVCNYSCKLKEKLKRHSLIHSNEKPFSCEQCNYVCKTKELLKRHMIVHTREKVESSKKVLKKSKKK